MNICKPREVSTPLAVLSFFCSLIQIISLGIFIYHQVVLDMGQLNLFCSIVFIIWGVASIIKMFINETLIDLLGGMAGTGLMVLGILSLASF